MKACENLGPDSHLRCLEEISGLVVVSVGQLGSPPDALPIWLGPLHTCSSLGSFRGKDGNGQVSGWKRTKKEAWPLPRKQGYPKTVVVDQ